MSCASASYRRFLVWLALAVLLAGCRTPPAPVAVTTASSLLAVDVRFPSPLSRDHSLVQVFFARGPLDAESDELPELLPASFVKSSRAYLLDPEPGTYAVVAVTSQLVPPVNNLPVAGGVTQTVVNKQLGHVEVFPAELVRRTNTAVGPGNAAFMGVLQVRRGERINSGAVLQDDLQRRIAERIDPGVTTRSGPAGWFSVTWMVDLAETSFSNVAADREAFFDDAVADLGDSPWSWFLARRAPRDGAAARARAPSPGPAGVAPRPEAAARPQGGIRAPAPVAPPPDGSPSGAPPVAPAPAGSPDSPLATPEPDAAPSDAVAPAAEVVEVPEGAEDGPPVPEEPPAPPPLQYVAGIPAGNPLSKIPLGMHHSEVRKLLGDPDVEVERLTAKAWIPFNTGPGSRLFDWKYDGIGTVVFSQHTGRLVVFDVVAEPDGPQ